MDEMIIEFVKNHPCLFDKGKYFNNIRSRNILWNNLADEISENLQVTVPEEQVRNRWKYLAETFTREHKKVSSGTSYSKEWEFYRQMLFLVPYISHRRGKSSFFLDLDTPKFNNKDISGTILISEDSVICTDDLNSVDQQVKQERCPTEDSQERTSKRQKRVPDRLSETHQATQSTVAVVENKTGLEAYLAVTQEGLKNVPLKDRTSCIIEILQVIQRYERWEN